MPRRRAQRRIRGVQRSAIEAARDLRIQSTSAESVLWEAIRGRRLNGLKFRRQYPIGPYILDFCCPEHRLVIEVEGAHHDEQQEYDQGRTEHLEQYGYKVLRFRNDEVMRNLDHVLDRIIEDVHLASASAPAKFEAVPNKMSESKKSG